MSKRVLIAMSGGVDSSVAAYLLKEQGYDLCGITLLLNGQGSIETNPEIQSAKEIAGKLGFPHIALDWRQLFREEIILPFAKSYENAKTPNPCVLCNNRIKFGKLMEETLARGFDFLATGHYARVQEDPISHKTTLFSGKCTSKDQSYFLYTLNESTLSHVLFPLGSMDKESVRKIAEEQGFETAHKKDSQDICFIPNGDYVSFLTNELHCQLTPGYYVNKNGDVLGKHADQRCYTIGQRKGLGIAMGHPVYVLSKNADTNEVVLGENEDLFQTTLLAEDVHWILPQTSFPITCKAKIRYAHKPSTAIITELDSKHVSVQFIEPQRAMAPGQSVVFYQEDQVLGGGIIQSSKEAFL